MRRRREPPGGVGHGAVGPRSASAWSDEEIARHRRAHEALGLHLERRGGPHEEGREGLGRELGADLDREGRRHRGPAALLAIRPAGALGHDAQARHGRVRERIGVRGIFAEDRVLERIHGVVEIVALGRAEAAGREGRLDAAQARGEPGIAGRELLLGARRDPRRREPSEQRGGRPRELALLGEAQLLGRERGAP